jgi:phosphoglycerate dehydrogenase-like enzyme
VTSVNCCVAPRGAPTWLADAVVSAGGALVSIEAAEALIWWHADAGELSRYVSQGPGLRWIQLPSAGVDPYLAVVDRDHLWTCAKGVYGDPVAEHALALILACYRDLPGYARRKTWSPAEARTLYGAKLLVVGGGGVAQAFLRLIHPFDCRVTVLRRNPIPIAGADVKAELSLLPDLASSADVVLLAASLTPATAGAVNRSVFEAMGRHTLLVNIARGGLVRTDHLVDALREQQIGGAALDVTDPEPLPEGHPLWRLPNCFITPHVGNTMSMHRPLLIRFTVDNIRRYARGEQLAGVVNPDEGY